MRELHPFDYAVIRVVPWVEREEFINAGVIVSCLPLDFLEAQIEVDPERLAAFAPSLDLDAVRRHLEAIPRICAGEGPIGRLTRRERFYWLSSARSTIIQPSPVHTGLCEDPRVALEHLVDGMVRLPRAR